MYKLYIKVAEVYIKPEIYNTYREALKHARGEYMIIKSDKNGDEVIERGVITGKGRKDFER